MTDSELLTQFVSNRDRSALVQIVNRYERLVWSVCHRTLRHPSDIEDAFQTTFLVLTGSAHRIRKRESLSNWLYGVARRSAVRIRNRRAITLLEDVLDDSVEPADNQPTVLEMITRQHEIDLVDQKLETMQEKYRTPLVLKYFSGLTAKQIANQLDLSVATVEGRLRRAKTKLRWQFRNEGFQFGAGTLLGCGFPGRPAFVIATSEKSIAASVGLSTVVNNAISTTGIKLMICKGICAVGITMMLAVGGVLHTGAFVQDTDAVATCCEAKMATTELTSEFVTINQGDEEADGCCNNCPCEDCCSVLEHAHSHLEVAHDLLLIHFRQLCGVLGCCD